MECIHLKSLNYDELKKNLVRIKSEILKDEENLKTHNICLSVN